MDGSNIASLPLAAELRRGDRGVSLLSVNGPAPSTWTADRRQKFIATLRRAAARSSTRAIVLTGPHVFRAASDEASRTLAEDCEAVLEAILASPVPVIAAISTPAGGFGFEIAAACAWRVATPSAVLAFDSLPMGRLPRPSALAALSQRMGIEATGLLLARGKAVSAGAALALGLVDAVAEDSVARSFELADGAIRGSGPGRVSPTDVEAALFGLRRQVRKEFPGQAAPLTAVRALELALKAPRRRGRGDWEGLQAEFAEGPEGVALRYAAEGAAEVASSPVDPADLVGELRWPLMREALHLLDEGASPAQIDRLLEAFGFAEGPFGLSDRIGLEKVFDPPPRGAWLTYSATLDLMLGAGRLGGAEAPGWYRSLSDGSAVRFDPEVERLIQTSAMSQRLTRTQLSDQAVSGRCRAAIVSASAQVLEKTPGLTRSAVDAIWTGWLGFPRWRGGPLHMAQIEGLAAILEALDGQNPLRRTSGPACDLLRAWAANGRCPDPLSDPVRSPAFG